MNWLDLGDVGERVLRGSCAARPSRFPTAPFILSGESCLSYGQVDVEADAYAAGLHSLGVGKGDTVAILMESCPEFVILALACNRLGAVWVPTNIDYKGQWLQDSLTGSRAAVVAVGQRTPAPPGGGDR